MCVQSVCSYENKAAGVFVSVSMCVVCVCVCVQSVHSYENKAAGVFVSVSMCVVCVCVFRVFVAMRTRLQVCL